ncbi:MAG: ABC transporter permease subunit [Butyricicoccus sp.]|nr:ABC transporter permease subunit [Butyricicoccus sp.]
MNRLKTLLPVLAAALALLADWFWPDSAAHPAAAHSYFAILLAVVLVLTAAAFLASLTLSGFRENYTRKAPFYAGVLLFLCILNILTAKTAVLPVLYFPSLDRVFGVLMEDIAFIGKCLLYSLRLQLVGWLCGAAVGVLTGIAIGFNRHVRYWIQPLVRVLGPIPSTAWIPLVLVSFPTVVSASTFLIALAVWFPTSVLTSSGIASIHNSYFEAAATLGASSRYTILRVGIPAAMPHMFIGLFNGTCASFITLVTAEMLGAKYGIGWYINWQKDMMAYANVYAGLIVMSLTCYCIITLLFRARDKVLVWQKGVIKW